VIFEKGAERYMSKYFKWILCFSFLVFIPVQQIHAAQPPSQSTKQKTKKPSKQKASSSSSAMKEKNKKATTGATVKKQKKVKNSMAAKTGFSEDQTKSREASPINRQIPTSVDYSNQSNAASFISGIFGFLFVPLLIAGFLMIVSWWKIFVKAGREGWESLVPILNLVRILQISHVPLWAIILCFIPVANVVFPLWLGYALAKSFNKSVGYALGLIFLPVFFYPHLAFSDASYGSDYGSSVGGLHGFKMAS
jgi:hypothetical protein